MNNKTSVIFDNCKKCKSKCKYYKKFKNSYCLNRKGNESCLGDKTRPDNIVNSQQCIKCNDCKNYMKCRELPCGKYIPVTLYVCYCGDYELDPQYEKHATTV